MRVRSAGWCLSLVVYTYNLNMYFLCLTCTLLLLVFVNTAPISEDYDLAEDYNSGEFGDYFEGDMVLTPAQRSAVFDVEGGRNGLRDNTKRWPKKTVVYKIVDDDFDEGQVEMIEEALADIANNSCIKFRKQKADEHAVIIQGTANGCFSGVGYNKVDDSEEADQVLNLAKGCFKHGTIVHEMLHTLGFYHMQSTYDRDEYVEVVWENIKEGLEHNFAKYNNDTVTDYGVPYDYGSVMHIDIRIYTRYMLDVCMNEEEDPEDCYLLDEIKQKAMPGIYPYRKVKYTGPKYGDLENTLLSRR